MTPRRCPEYVTRRFIDLMTAIGNDKELTGPQFDAIAILAVEAKTDKEFLIQALEVFHAQPETSYTMLMNVINRT